MKTIRYKLLKRTRKGDWIFPKSKREKYQWYTAMLHYEVVTVPDNDERTAAEILIECFREASHVYGYPSVYLLKGDFIIVHSSEFDAKYFVEFTPADENKKESENRN